MICGTQSRFALAYCLGMGVAALVCRAEVPSHFTGVLNRPVYGIRGDANEDGTVDVADAVFTLRYLFGKKHPPEFSGACPEAMDVDASDTLSITDAIGLLLWLFDGGGPALTATCERFDVDIEITSCVSSFCPLVVDDFSDFDEFVYEVRGREPVLGDVLQARVIRESDEFRADFKMLVEGNREVDDCWDGYRGLADCATVVSLPSLSLSAAEVEPLIKLFAQVEIAVLVHDSVCAFILVVPREQRRTRVFSWDGAEVADMICWTPKVTRFFSDSVARVLEDLRVVVEAEVGPPR